MVVDAVRTYLDAVSGLTELTRKRAVAAAKTLLKDGDAQPRAAGDPATTGPSNGADPTEGTASANGVGHSIQRLASDLIETNQANREALSRLVEEEVERVLGRMDLVQRSEYDRLARRVAELERRLAHRVPAARPAADETAVPGSASAAPPGETAAPTEQQPAADTPAAAVPATRADDADQPDAPAGDDAATAAAATTPSATTASEASGDGTGESATASEPAEAVEAAPAPAEDAASDGGGTGTASTGTSGTQKKKSASSDKAKSSSGTRARTTTKSGSTKRSSGRGKNTASAKSAKKSDQN